MTQIRDHITGEMIEAAQDGMIVLADVQIDPWKQGADPTYERDVLGILYPDGKFTPARQINTFWVFPPETVTNVRRQIVLNMPMTAFHTSSPSDVDAARFLADVLKVAPLSDRAEVSAFYRNLTGQLEAQYGDH